MSRAMKIYCCKCKKYVNARLTNGKEIYPYRKDLHKLPFWKCDKCKNYVGCHHKTRNRTKPLGCISTKKIREIRTKIHRILDPIWKSGKRTRDEIYTDITEYIGWRYHTSEIRDMKTAIKIYDFVKRYKY